MRKCRKFPTLTTYHRNKNTVLLLPVFLLPCSLLPFFYPAANPGFLLFISRHGAVAAETSDANSNATTSWDVPRVAICLVGGARRFELTGPSFLDRVVNVFPNADLFLRTPLDENSYKLSLLRGARRIAAVNIFQQRSALPETAEQRQLLDAESAPGGVQGLLRYFHLVEGCLRMINEYQTKNQIQYDWILRTRVDGYWSAPLTDEVLVPRTYIVPTGSAYGGLNDRFGEGDLNTSMAALSRIYLIPKLFAAGYRNLNSESAFKAQLVIQKIHFREVRLPFCIISDRQYTYPPDELGVPVASITSPNPLNGAKCRPCEPVCTGNCSYEFFRDKDPHFNWIDGDPNLCDAHNAWEMGWERVFDRVAGEKYAAARKSVGYMDLGRCIRELDLVQRRAVVWDAPSASKICRIGLGPRKKQQIRS